MDSADRATTQRVYRFAYGDQSGSGDHRYRYAGFVELEGVRYLGQSVLFVLPSRLAEIDGVLTANRVEHEGTAAALG